MQTVKYTLPERGIHIVSNCVTIRAAGNAGTTSGRVVDAAVRRTVAQMDGGLKAPDGNEAGARHFLYVIAVEAKDFFLSVIQF